MRTSSIPLLLRFLLAAVVFVPSMGQSQPAIPTPKFAFAEPSLSPDGAEVAFVSGGDIWTVPSVGGEARLLVSHPDNESRPLYSPDGKYLAFVSSRTGNGDVYLLTLETGAIKRLTYDDGAEVLNAWSRDGKMVYFQSTSRDIAGMNDIYRVSVAGGTPMAITADRYANEFYGAPSPDGKTLAFSARGIASNQWWRKGHSHLDETELWLYHTDAKKSAAYERITEGGAKELWPMWSQDGKSLFYVSDRTQAQNLWTQPLGGKPTMLTTFTNGRVLWPSIGYDGKTIVFERDFQLWKYDIASRQAAPIAVRLRGVAASPAVERLKLTNQFRELSLSPDGKKVAFVAHGEVFAASVKEGGDATRISHSAANESQPAWTPNSRSLVYTSTRDGISHLYRYDFATRDETRLTDGTLDDGSPVFSPDGKLLAYVRNGQELRVLDIATKKDRLLKKAYLGRPPFGSNGAVVWSPDGKWIAFASYGAKTFRNISIIPAAGGESKPVSFLANTFGGNVSWSPDGKYILFGTTQRTETAQIARIDLVPRSPKFREDQFRDLFNEEVPKTLKPAPTSPAVAKTATRDTSSLALGDTAKLGRGGATKIVFDDIRQRLSLLPVGVDVDAHSISKDGKTLLLIATVAGQQNLYTYSLDELGRDQSVARQLTSTAGSKNGAQFSPDGKEIVYLEQGRIQSITLDKREPKPLAITAEMDVDFGDEKVQVFRQAWDIQSKGFYDSTFHGADWKAIRAEYEPLAAGSRTPDELRRLISLMLGELNASHSGISAPAGSVQTTTGRLGLRFDRAEYENTGKLKITEVIALSPAALSGTIKPGDYLLGVDDTKITATTNLDQLLENQINRRLALMIASSSTAPPQEVTVRPVNLTTEKGLLYKQWVQQQRQYVEKVSGGRLGYVHMYDMSAESLAQLSLDLDADNHAREGVVVDVRNNNGGFVNAYALDVFTRKGYLTMTSRGLPAAPARTQLGQRALETPTILVTNQHSLSDAEDFTEGYRTLKLGKVVGEPTAGWIIFTSAAQLIDGSNLRLPFSKITDNTGKNMELAPRPVDIAVSRPIGESFTDKNIQLDTAVAELIKELNEAKASKLSTGK